MTTPAPHASPTPAHQVRPGQWIETRSDDGWVWQQVTDTQPDPSPDMVAVACGPHIYRFGCNELVLTAGRDLTGVVPARRDRPDWDRYFLTVADAAKMRANCRRRAVGAVIFGPDHRLISTGYNGAPAGLPGCFEGACPRGLLGYDDLAARSPYDEPASPGYCTAIHAEVNAVLYAGTAARGASMAISAAPCPNCVKTSAGAGIVRMVWATADGEVKSGEPARMLLARRTETD